KLGEVLGVCRLAAAAAGVRVVSYAPRRVKKAVVGRGQADKIQVQGMVTLILGLSSPPEPLDISDALALGIACLHDLRLASLESSGG
ncbi:MAG TPA: crossover junction endodeoxyribonuclease RuvC, partial [bacterium]|nr:crossover junction endodeoxyribonuclease RuvC [bacterium]